MLLEQPIDWQLCTTTDTNKIATGLPNSRIATHIGFSQKFGPQITHYMVATNPNMLSGVCIAITSNRSQKQPQSPIGLRNRSEWQLHSHKARQVSETGQTVNCKATKPNRSLKQVMHADWKLHTHKARQVSETGLTVNYTVTKSDRSQTDNCTATKPDRSQKLSSIKLQSPTNRSYWQLLSHNPQSPIGLRTGQTDNCTHTKPDRSQNQVRLSTVKIRSPIQILQIGQTDNCTCSDKARQVSETDQIDNCKATKHYRSYK